MQTLLLVLGVGLVTLAVISFGWFAYGLLGDLGRASSIGMVGVVALVCGILAAPRLRATAEGLGWAGLLALSVSAFLFGDAAPLPVEDGDMLLAGLLLMATSVVAFGIRLAPLTGAAPPLRAHGVFAVVALPLSVSTMVTALPMPIGGFSRVGVNWCAGALAAAVLSMLMPADQRHRHPDFERLTATVTASVMFVVPSVLVYPALSHDKPLWPALLLWPSTMIGVLLVLLTLHLRRLAGSDRTAPDGFRAVPMLELVVSAVAACALFDRLLQGTMPDDWARAWSNGTAVLAAATALGLGCLLSDRSEVLDKAERVAASLAGSVVLLVLVCSEFTRTDKPSLLPAMAAYAVLVAVTAGAWMRAARPVERIVGLMPTHMRPNAAPIPIASPIPPSTPYPTNPAAPSYPAPSEAVPPHAPAAAGTYPHSAPYPAPMAASPMPQAPQTTVVKARGLDAGGVIALGSALIATVYLFLDTAFVSSFLPQRAPVDLIIGITGAAALAVGGWWMVRWPALRSTKALSLGLVLMTVPSLLLSWHEAPAFPRMLALFVIAVGAIVLGAVARLKFPLVYGSVLLVVHVVTVLWPWIRAFSQDFWWVWLLVAGVLLIAIAARYEANVNSMRTLAGRIGDLR